MLFGPGFWGAAIGTGIELWVFEEELPRVEMNEVGLSLGVEVAPLLDLLEA